MQGSLTSSVCVLLLLLAVAFYFSVQAFNNQMRSRTWVMHTYHLTKSVNTVDQVIGTVRQFLGGLVSRKGD